MHMLAHPITLIFLLLGPISLAAPTVRAITNPIGVGADAGADPQAQTETGLLPAQAVPDALALAVITDTVTQLETMTVAAASGNFPGFFENPDVLDEIERLLEIIGEHTERMRAATGNDKSTRPGNGKGNRGNSIRIECKGIGVCNPVQVEGHSKGKHPKLGGKLKVLGGFGKS